MQQHQEYISVLAENVYCELPKAIQEKLEVEDLEQFFFYELAFMKSKKLLIEGVVISCEDECEDLDYFLQFNMVKHNVFLDSIEVETILSLEQEYWEYCVECEKPKYYSL